VRVLGVRDAITRVASTPARATPWTLRARTVCEGHPAALIVARLASLLHSACPTRWTGNHARWTSQRPILLLYIERPPCRRNPKMERRKVDRHLQGACSGASLLE